jgi:hypothetical protein
MTVMTDPLQKSDRIELRQVALRLPIVARAPIDLPRESSATRPVAVSLAQQPTGRNPERAAQRPKAPEARLEVLESLGCD